MKAEVEQVETVLAAPMPQERFASRKLAMEWIRQKGGKVSQGKFYQDCAEGKVLVYPDKSVSRASTAEYLLRLQRPIAPVLDSMDRTQQKERLELERLQLEVEKLRRIARADDRRWMRMEDHCAQVAVILTMLRDNLQHYGQQSATELAHICRGDVNLAPLLVDGMAELVLGRAYNELAGQLIEHGMFTEEEDHGTK